MVHHDGACRIYGAVRHDDDKDGASVSVETVLNKMGDSVPEKGRLLLRNHLLIFVPYIVITLTTFYWTLKQRSYTIRDLMSGQLLTFITFPVFMKASVLALLGFKGTFGITPKGMSRALPLRAMWPQLLLWAICLCGAVWGVNRLVYEREPFAGILVNVFWCLYHAAILSSIFYFNTPVEGAGEAGEEEG